MLPNSQCRLLQRLFNVGAPGVPQLNSVNDGSPVAIYSDPRFCSMRLCCSSSIATSTSRRLRIRGLQGFMVDSLILVAPEEYQALEIFAGVATLSRCLRLGGYNVAALEIDFWPEYAQARGLPTKNNPMDLTRPAGMAPPGVDTD